MSIQMHLVFQMHLSSLIYMYFMTWRSDGGIICNVYLHQLASVFVEIGDRTSDSLSKILKQLGMYRTVNGSFPDKPRHPKKFIKKRT